MAVILKDANGNVLRYPAVIIERQTATDTGGVVLAKIGDKRTTFAVVSDVHLYANTSSQNNTVFASAMNRFEALGVDFVACCGDHINWNPASEFPAVKQAIAAANVTYYPIAGNHDAAGVGDYYSESAGIDVDNWIDVTGRQPCYRVDFNGDTYLFFSHNTWKGAEMYSSADKAWLLGQLEDVKDKGRVFLFCHQYYNFGSDIGFAYRDGTKANTYINGDTSNSGKVSGDAEWWESMMETYPNIIWFSGHSHTGFAYAASYPNVLAYRGKSTNIHVPRLNVSGYSQYYLVDVYDEAVKIQGYQDGVAYDNTLLLVTNRFNRQQASVYHTVTGNCIGYTLSAVETVADGVSFVGKLTLQRGYTDGTITVTMGGADITSTALYGTTISISSVTGDIVITATAVQKPEIETVLATIGDITLTLSSSNTIKVSDNNIVFSELVHSGDDIRFRADSYTVESGTESLLGVKAGFFENDGAKHYTGLGTDPVAGVRPGSRMAEYVWLDTSILNFDKSADLVDGIGTWGGWPAGGVVWRASSSYASSGGTYPLTVSFTNLRVVKID